MGILKKIIKIIVVLGFVFLLLYIFYTFNQI